jgi:tetratricopeptide (TPR) repeat protein
MKRIDEAEACLRATLIQRESILDNDSVFVVDARASLGAFLLRSGRYAEAEPILEEVIASRRRTHVSPEQVATGLCNLGRCKMMTGKFQEAESDLISADAIFVKNLGENHEWTLSNRRSIILLYEKMKRLDDAYHWRGLANLPR